MEKAVGYVRVSTDEQATNGESLDIQANAIRSYCEAQGLELVDLVIEGGVSGYTPLADRPGGQRVLSLLQKREAKHVVTVKLDRMFRRASDALDLTATWDKSNVGLHVLNMGGQAVNTATAVGRVFLSMLAVFAEFERNLIAERTKEAMGAKRARGERVSRHIPYGYELAGDGVQLKKNRTEQRLLKLIYGLRDDGLSLRAIADELNRRGRATRSGSPWRHQYVANVLLRAS